MTSWCGCRATYPEEPGPVRDEGVCLWALGRHADCAECLRDYLLAAPNAEDAQQVQLSLIVRISMHWSDPSTMYWDLMCLSTVGEYVFLPPICARFLPGSSILRVHVGRGGMGKSVYLWWCWCRCLWIKCCSGCGHALNMCSYIYSTLGFGESNNENECQKWHLAELDTGLRFEEMSQFHINRIWIG